MQPVGYMDTAKFNQAVEIFCQALDTVCDAQGNKCPRPAYVNKKFVEEAMMGVLRGLFNVKLPSTTQAPLITEH